jgi:hypothetical protein
MSEHQREFDEEQMREILARAAELDNRTKVTETELVQIAKEVGISEAAVRNALSETVPTVDPSRTHPWRQAIWCGVTACGVGALARSLRPLLNAGGMHLESLGLIAILTAALFAIAWRRRPYGQRTYQRVNLAVWAGMTVGWSVVNGSLWGDLVGVTAAWAGCSAVVGGLIVHVRSGDVLRGPTGRDGEKTSRLASMRSWIIRQVKQVRNNIFERWITMVQRDRPAPEQEVKGFYRTEANA